MSVLTGERMRQPEAVERQRSALSDAWKNPDFRERISTLTSERISNAEFGASYRAKWQSYTCRSGSTIRVLGSFERRTAAALDAWRYAWERNRDRFRYVGWDFNNHWYTPDFKVWLGTQPVYIETKGYLSYDDTVKLYMLCLSGLPRTYVLFEEDIKELEAGRAPFTSGRELINIAHQQILKYVPVTGRPKEDGR